MKEPILNHLYLNKKLYVTQQRSITKRGVLWVGLKCDLKCIFCYDVNYNRSEKVWLPFEGNYGLKNAINKIKYFYKNQFIDFMGGEPTLYPNVFDLVKYCNEIQLYPTLITHGLKLSKLNFARKFKEAGINDFLISIHGLGETSDRIFGVKNRNIISHQIKALENLRELEISFRCNITITSLNVKQLPDITRLCISHGCIVINFISFNPYFEWEKFNNIWFQIQHKEAIPYLKESILICCENNVEVNIRYLPICLMKGFEEYVYTGFQLPYDMHEWDYNSWYDLGADKNKNKYYYLKLSQLQRKRHNYIQTDSCLSCSIKNICDGFHSQYVQRWGNEEAHPYKGILIKDPTYFIRKQKKVFYEPKVTSTNSHYKPQISSLSQFDETVSRAGVMMEH